MNPKMLMTIFVFVGSIAVIPLLGGGQFSPIQGTQGADADLGNYNATDEGDTRQSVFSTLNTISNTFQGLSSTNPIITLIVVIPILAIVGYYIAHILNFIIPFT